MALRINSRSMAFGGEQLFCEHDSEVIGLPMKFGLYLPPQIGYHKVPLLMFLAGLTCTEETFAFKSGAQRLAAELGLAILTPDTSPRATGVPGADTSWELGHGASFYLDATQSPWSRHFRMESWLTEELLNLVREEFPSVAGQWGISGHSMGGHGALTLALRHPGKFASVSAISPVCAPFHCRWGKQAFAAYLGDDRAAWRDYDATELIQSGWTAPPLLVDVGTHDKFMQEQLNIDRLERICRGSGQALNLRRHEGYDHSYFFIATVIEDHLRHHTAQLEV